MLLAAGLLAEAGAEGTFYKNKRKPAAVEGSASAAAPAAATPPAPSPPPAPPPPPAPSPPTTAPASPPAEAPAPAPAPPVAPASPAPTRPAETAATPVSGSVDSVVATDTLMVGGRRVRLAGLDGITGPALPSMAQWLRSNGNQVTCTPQGARHRCLTATGKDVAQVVLLNGLGRATSDAPPLYQEAERQAKASAKGVWAPR
ncbi:MAG: hypothetical protein KF788_18625 [Piscinibacter sp.]|nr:hypothetical protein [Piscinibacter sp.]